MTPLAIPTVSGGVAQKPDLLVPSLRSPPPITNAGGTVAIREAARNTGRMKAKASRNRYTPSADRKADATDLALGSRAVRALRPKRSSTKTTQLVLPAGRAPGVYRVIVCADSRDKANPRTTASSPMICPRRGTRREVTDDASVILRACAMVPRGTMHAMTGMRPARDCS